MSNQCYRIPTELTYIFNQKIESFNRKAKKLKQETIHVQTHKQQLIDNCLYDWVEIIGEFPKIPNYTMIGKIEFSDIIIPSSAPGRTIPEQYYMGESVSSHCDHCSSNRARKVTFILQDTDGKYIQVGSSCLSLFIDRDLARYISQYFSFFYEMENFIENEEENYYTDEYVNVVQALYRAQVCIEQFGWISKTKADSDPEGLLESTFSMMCDKDDRLVTEERRNTVNEAILWLESRDSEGDEYIYKLKMFVNQEFIKYNHVGFLISLLGSYKNYKLREAKKELENETKSPVIKGRVDLTGIVLKTDCKETNWGYRDVMTFKDDRGFLVWGSIPKNKDVKSGTRLSFKATVSVSDNDEYFGFYKRPTKFEAA